MSTCKYKLTYFNFNARAEFIRLIFAAAGVEFEDNRVSRKPEEWEVAKKSLPFQQVPVLEIEGGVVLAHSHAIGRYLANEFGLAGKTNMERAKVDMIVDAAEDLFPPIRVYNFAPEDKKQAACDEIVAKLPPGLSNLERVLTQNNGGDGFFVGDSLTWADLKFFGRIGENIQRIKPEILKDYPKLAALCDRVAAIPRIKEWIEKRPKVQF
ncbi:hematopoietic prostaglandin D synthase-like [Ptychodera flava]|uniref:hematopoietic prostaglandin D synthase-like n=1 Tax=Ptychodera flava TaxID=63121 RepID=UPI003969C0C1